MGVYLENSTFYHLPRTGGTWVAEVLLSGAVKGNITKVRSYKRGVDAFINNKHIPPALLKPKNFSFAFVRHPLDWYKSVWKFRTKHDGTWKVRRYCELTTKCGRDNFADFIDALIENCPDGYYNRVVDKFSPVDFMGRQELLTDDLIKALTLAGEKFDEEAIRNYKRANVSRNIELSYTPEQKKKLLKIEKKVIDSYY